MISLIYNSWKRKFPVFCRSTVFLGIFILLSTNSFAQLFIGGKLASAAYAVERKQPGFFPSTQSDGFMHIGLNVGYSFTDNDNVAFTYYPETETTLEFSEGVINGTILESEVTIQVSALSYTHIYNNGWHIGGKYVLLEVKEKTLKHSFGKFKTDETLASGGILGFDFGYIWKFDAVDLKLNLLLPLTQTESSASSPFYPDDVTFASSYGEFGIAVDYNI